MAEQYKSLHPLKFYRDHLAHNIRPDGRELDKFRPVIINTGSISTANGSAIVKIGRTTIVCGIKVELCQPKPELPDSGFLIPNVELPPLCSQKFRPGPPSDLAQVTTKIIADIIESSKCVDLKDLCLLKDKLVWCMFADMVCIDFDGAVADACLLALAAALKTVKLPSVTYDTELEKIAIDMEDMKPLTVYNTPVSTTYAVFDDSEILIDPTHDEENLCTGIITVVVNKGKLCSVLKPGGTPIKDDDLSMCIKQAINREALLMKLIESALQENNGEN